MQLILAKRPRNNAILQGKKSFIELEVQSQKWCNIGWACPRRPPLMAGW